MELKSIQVFLIALFILLLLFIFGRCKLWCNKGPSEGFYNQIRDNVSSPYFGDDCSHGGGCQLFNYHEPSGFAKGMPLTARGEPCPKTAYGIIQDTTCPECTTQVMRFY